MMMMIINCGDVGNNNGGNDDDNGMVMTMVIKRMVS